MTIPPNSQSSTYWEDFSIQETDLEFIYNHLLDLETPQTPQELLKALVDERIRKDKEALEKQQEAEGSTYLPKNSCQPGQILIFPAFQWKKGEVVGIRPGVNPEIGSFDIVDIRLENGERKQIAARLENHILNQSLPLELDTNQLDHAYVMRHFGSNLQEKLVASLEDSPEIVRIAGRWFPRSLLVDVNVGHLNLAEALLDMEGGGPLTTTAILEQIEMPTGVNSKLTEFSLNHALQEDSRFDEVGPTGEILWYLRKLEPAAVQSIPNFLKTYRTADDPVPSGTSFPVLSPYIVDELEPEKPAPDVEETKVALIYPHWQAGTLPLSGPLAGLFPSAYESPRIQFTFRDAGSGEKFQGWVVRSSKYVFGLGDWYNKQGLIPGNYIQVCRSDVPGEILLRIDKHKPNREWVRTTMVGSDGNLVFGNLRQLITAPYDERMVVAIADPEALQKLWEQGTRSRQTLEQIITGMMFELAKLNPQGHVHIEGLYAAVNLVFRCPPRRIMHIMFNRSWARHVGDLYFRMDRSSQKEAIS